MLANLHTRPAFNRSHRFICADNPDGKSGADVVAQVYGPDALRRSELFAAAPDLLSALKALFENYKELADSGDAGFWPLENTPEGKQALAAIARAEGRSDA